MIKLKIKITISIVTKKEINRNYKIMIQKILILKKLQQLSKNFNHLLDIKAMTDMMSVLTKLVHVKNQIPCLVNNQIQILIANKQNQNISNSKLLHHNHYLIQPKFLILLLSNNFLRHNLLKINISYTLIIINKISRNIIVLQIKTK